MLLLRLKKEKNVDRDILKISEDFVIYIYYLMHFWKNLSDI